jgi:arabinogalactan endo-1,4-beta-galactosidase
LRTLLAALAVPIAAPAATPVTDVGPVLGVDLSYVNEVEGCGAEFSDGTRVDPFAILAAHGANLVRARLWHDPQWTEYSTTDDVIRTFQRAESHGLRTLLDFHYSDDWADPGRQDPPAAWSAITDVDGLAAALGAYTRDTLERFHDAGVLPDMVQIGNEINGGLVKSVVELDWDHDLPLLEAGITAVREVSEATGERIDVLIHVAQPENALDWFEQAADAGLSGFDVIGLSYYPQWSRFSVAELGSAVRSLAGAYGVEVLVVETAYPWTHESAGDTADNILDQALRAYDVSPGGQAAFMGDVTATVVANGGLGTVYWEPAWVSTSCRTRWGEGSHWENATLFDFDGALHAGADYLGGDYRPLALPSDLPLTTGDPTGDAAQAAGDVTGLSVGADERAVAVSATFAGDVRDWPGSVILAVDNAAGGGDGGRRSFDFAGDQRPELLVESAWEDDPGVGFVSSDASTWGGGDWQEDMFTGWVEIAAGPGSGSTVTWVLPSSAVAADAAITAVVAERGRAGALADVIEPGTPDEPVAMAIHLGGDP